MQRRTFTVVPGDGVGPEVVGAALPVLDAAARGAGADLTWQTRDWGADHYLRTGAAMPADGVDQVRAGDGVLFGAVGRPDVPDHELIWGLILKLRQGLDLAVNVRPARSLSGLSVLPVPAPPAAESTGERREVDLVVIRENTEGEYAGVGGRVRRGTPEELGLEVAVHSATVIERVARFAFETARGRRGRVALVTKSNVMRYGYTLWDEVTGRVAEEYSDVAYEKVLVDAMATRLVQRPDSLDVLLCGNLFGDVLSDLTAGLVGGLGVTPSANLPIGAGPGLFEAVHGSAPDIAGQGVANPVATLLSGAMLLDHAGLGEAGRAVRDAVAAAVADPAHRTRDLGGTASTQQLADAVLTQLPQVPDRAPREGLVTSQSAQSMEVDR
ncbi:MAG TPA: isocitrate/isopropylmalate dehydrogenase family protein [Nocardioidaceae bacterium]|nr:isocitrate/isopropylmalate dehydrogenase family protein [Nocardioidaceae bacterium]